MRIDYAKYDNGLVPAIIQDAETNTVLMLGFMNQAAVEKTIETSQVTFFSRSKNRLWTKGEESGNFLQLISIEADCDQDSLLIKVIPAGPVCHNGTDTCWGNKNEQTDFLQQLEKIIMHRKNSPDEKSYTSSLFFGGMNKIAQKVGEEAIELVIEAKDDNNELFINEAADLLFHYLILLQAKGFTFQDVKDVLKARHQNK